MKQQRQGGRELDELWSTVMRKCLQRAENLLDRETIPTVEIAGTVRELVETAITIQRNRSESPIGPGTAIHLEEGRRQYQ